TANTLRFFASPTCDPSGNGEGIVCLGTSSGTTDPAGNSPFGVTLPVSVAVGQFITATATSAAGTSEFSACVQAVSGGGGAGTTDIQVTQTDNPDPVVVNNQLTYSLTVRNNG